ncbi:glucosidase II beta subunit-like-domain-containing protein [Sporodiniella umbellata]|nr:glucosidase II beta subunit-like-domain-containing protein [Sporodiniella umbellata]
MVLLGLRLPYIIAAAALVKASSLMGIPSEKQISYRAFSDGTWKCLDGSKVIAHSAINDDYCDCPDGSDEPGTSACPNGRFYCKNEGHIPSYIKSSSVRDNVCDEECCDGTDEDDGICPNRCQIVGETYRKEKAAEKIAVDKGLKTKRQWIVEAQTKVDSWENEKIKLEEEVTLKKADAMKLESQLKTLESQNQKTKHTCPTYTEEISILKNDISILKDELELLQNILHDMKRDHNHNFHDMAVKSAISGYDEFANRYDQIKSDIDENIKDVDSKVEEYSQITIGSKENDSHEAKKSAMDAVYETLDSVLPDSIKLNVLDKLLPKKQEAEDDVYHDGARHLFEEAESELDRLNRELDEVKQKIDFDYGREKEWLTLKDVCIEKDEGEYTYSLCFLGDAYQKSNKDGSRTHLGKFKKFEGSKENIYKKHLHDQGTRCWNGPERSVKAIVDCGVENKILEVSEPEKCEYLYRILSPAVCQEAVAQSAKIPIHEEF